MKKSVAIFLSFFMLLAVFAPINIKGEEDADNTISDEGENETGIPITEEVEIKGFSEEQLRETEKNVKTIHSAGLQRVNGLLYYFDANGEFETGWQTVDGKTYYFHTTLGCALKDIQIIDGKYYFFDAGTNVLKYGVYKTNNGKAYYFLEDGTLGKGLKEWNGNSYILRATKSGAVAYGLNSINGKLYYADEETGKIHKNESINFSHLIIDFGSDGAMVKMTPEKGYEENEQVKLMQIAYSYLGTKYDLNSEDGGLSCGPYVAKVFSDYGYQEIANFKSYEQAKYFYDNDMMINKKDLKPGDTIYWQWDNCQEWYETNYGHQVECPHWDEIHHAGIYLGDGKVIECAESEGEVVVQDIHEYEGFRVKYCARVLIDEILVPGHLKVSLTNTNSAKLSWDKIDDVDGYDIYRKADGQSKMTYFDSVENNNITEYVDETVKLGSPIYYRVYAYRIEKGAKVLSAPGEYVYTVPRAYVKNLKSTFKNDAITVKWDTVQNVDGYNIYRASGNGEFKLLKQTKNTNYVDRDLQYNQTYFYRVKCFKMSGNDKTEGNSNQYVYSIPKIYPVSNLKAESKSSSTKLTWKNSKDKVDGYAVYKMKKNDKKLTFLYCTSNLSYEDFSASDEYEFYRVFPYIKKNNKLILGISNTYVYGKTLTK